MPGPEPQPAVLGRIAGPAGEAPLFRHVMACIDRSPQAIRILAEASALADLSAANLTAIRVLPVGPSGSPCADPVDWELTRREEIADLYRMAEIAGATADFDAILACGPAARCVEDEARRRGVDLLVMGAGNLDPRQKWGLGGTVRHLAEAFRGSVLVVPDIAADEPGRERRIIVPMDGSASAEAALRYAATIAQGRDAELVVLHALPDTALARNDAIGQEDRPLWREIEDEARRQADERIRRMRRLLPLASKRARVRRLDGDEPRRALLKAICEERGELVVLSARGLGKDPDLPVGSTAEYLLARAVTPTLLIRNAEIDTHRTTGPAPRRPAASRHGR